MTPYTHCACCGRELDIIEYPVLVAGKPPLVSVTCWQCECAEISGRTLSPAEHRKLCSAIIKERS